MRGHTNRLVYIEDAINRHIGSFTPLCLGASWSHSSARITDLLPLKRTLLAQRGYSQI